MADIKTNLRELGVVYSLKYCCEGKIADFGISPAELLGSCAEILKLPAQHLAGNVLNLAAFSTSQKQILKNGFKLALEIHKKLLKSTNDMPKIEWLGNDTGFAPCDIRVNGLSISLKEDSFILENMGLYKYLGLMTGKAYERGLHVFKYFAEKEYKAWFSYAWNKILKSSQSWELKKGKNISTIEFEKGSVVFKYNGQTSRLPNREISIDEYEKYTTAVTREKVFSKWIKEKCENESGYLAVKKKCAEAAGENLCLLVNKNLKHDNLARFLGIRKFEYYYAKSTSEETTILKVPALDNFERFFEVDSVSYSVPVSQLNIHTRVVNRTNAKAIEFRNECRFSHGQLNGTPEAKMYYPRGADLSEIFLEI